MVIFILFHLFNTRNSLSSKLRRQAKLKHKGDMEKPTKRKPIVNKGLHFLLFIFLSSAIFSQILPIFSTYLILSAGFFLVVMACLGAA